MAIGIDEGAARIKYSGLSASEKQQVLSHWEVSWRSVLTRKRDMPIHFETFQARHR